MERLWSEVNSRVNYPIKSVLVDMLQHGQFSLDNTIHFYCVSWLTRKVAAVGVMLHGTTIPYQVLHLIFFSVILFEMSFSTGRRNANGSRIPLQVSNRAQQLGPSVVPSTLDAVNNYVGRLSDPDTSPDPIVNDDHRTIRDATFYGHYPSFRSSVSRSCES